MPVTFAGWEVGNQIVTGSDSFKAKCNPRSPVYKAYELYNGFKGRASWDQIALLEAIEGPEPFFFVKKDGQCSVSADGSNKWIAASGKKHGYLSIKTSAEKIRDKIDRLMLGN